MGGRKLIEKCGTRVKNAGITVSLRYSTVNDGQITGYSVGWPGDRSEDGSQVMYGGSKLAKDLSWPRLQQRWAVGPLTGDPWLAAAHASNLTIAQIDRDPNAREHLASAVADMLDAAAAQRATNDASGFKRLIGSATRRLAGGRTAQRRSRGLYGAPPPRWLLIGP